MLITEVILTDEKEQELLEQAKKKVRNEIEWETYKDWLASDTLNISHVIMADMKLYDRYTRILGLKKDYLDKEEQLVIALYALLHNR